GSRGSGRLVPRRRPAASALRPVALAGRRRRRAARARAAARLRRVRCRLGPALAGRKGRFRRPPAADRPGPGRPSVVLPLAAGSRGDLHHPQSGRTADLALDRRRSRAATAGRGPAHRRPRGVALASARLQRGLLAQRRDRLFADFGPRRAGYPGARAVGGDALGAPAPTPRKSLLVSLTPVVSGP